MHNSHRKQRMKRDTESSAIKIGFANQLQQ